MKVHQTKLHGVLVIEPNVYEDDRGYFKETFNIKKFDLFASPVLQANQSKSKKGVIRGLHYQHPAVSKLVWVAHGSIYDVAYNIQSGEYHGEVLSAENGKQMLTPGGYAHGFQALEDDTVVCYLMDGTHNPEGDYGCDPMVIDWLIKDYIISEKDRNAHKLPDESSL